MSYNIFVGSINNLEIAMPNNSEMNIGWNDVEGNWIFLEVCRDKPETEGMLRIAKLGPELNFEGVNNCLGRAVKIGNFITEQEARDLDCVCEVEVWF